MSSVFGIIKFGLKTMLVGIDNSPCFNLAEQWVPEAIESAETGLTHASINLTLKLVSRASEIAMRMVATDKEMVIVVGFADGLGLSGNACGGLSAAIWMRTLAWCKDHAGKTPPLFNNKIAKKILMTFNEETSSETLCKNLTGQKFDSIKEHSNYIKCEGCAKLIEVLGRS